MASKYRIVIKRDFGSGPGHWLPNAGNTGTGNYGFVKSGFVVVKDGCNCIPGAMWFRTVGEAMLGIKAHLIAGDTQKWHDVFRGLKALKE